MTVYIIDHETLACIIAFLLIAITLLIAISIYCYLVKYKNKKKTNKKQDLLPFFDTNNKLKEVSN